MTSTATVQAVANEYGYGQYTRQINEVAAAVDRGETAQYVTRILNGYGVDRRVTDRITERLFATPVTSTPLAAFDKAGAAATIRAFIQNGSAHVGQNGASEEDVTALLVIAGLEDEVVPVAVDPEVQHAGLLTRLASWARGQGFSG